MTTAFPFLVVLFFYGPAVAQYLPPDMLADQYLLEATEAMEQGELLKALRAFEKIEALNIEPPPMFAYFYGKLLAEYGVGPAVWRKGQALLKQFVISAGRDSEYYTPTLKLLSRVEAKFEAARRAQADDAAYAQAQQADTATAYGKYLRAYPTGHHAAEAQTRQQERAETERLAQLPRELRNSIGMEFVLIQAGTFQMGSPATEPGRDDDEGPVHQVTISQPFYLGKYEVTQGQWQAVMGNNPSDLSGCGATCPMAGVSWNGAQNFIAELNRQEGTDVYRLPTEAEWEYAARAGTQTVYHFGNAASDLEFYAWYGEALFFGGIHPVGQKRPNEWGLYDMHGNVWEWVADWYGAYPRGPVTDPRGPSTGVSRVTRGGHWDGAARYCRVANRNRGPYSPSFHIGDSGGSGGVHFFYGFRLARTP
jgi:formylglycine-generating enzyme required for sulfatase activity